VTSYYNEHDPKAAQWLRNLIAAGHIAPGIVDERSIEDVAPDDLREFTQCHFFAGIGVWSYALRQAGWADDRQVWTGSCPCQPFSAAGKRAGFSDQRHLWPAFHHLIEQCRPAIVVGEQIASKDGLEWLDLVHADLEGSGYTVGAADLCAAGYGAPHIRQRLWFVGVADAVRSGSLPGPHAGVHSRESGTGSRYGELERPGAACGLANNDGNGCEPRREGSEAMGHGQATGADCGAVGLADAADQRQHGRRAGKASDGRDAARVEPERFCDVGPGRPSPTNGHWRNADWLRCRDEKWRPVEPGTSPLVDGAAARVVRLRAYGNAICAPVAQGFIEAVMEATP